MTVRRAGAAVPGRREKTMFTLVWIERLMGQPIIKRKEFKDRAERFRFIMKLEKNRFFDRVLEMN